MDGYRRREGVVLMRAANHRTISAALGAALLAVMAGCATTGSDRSVENVVAVTEAFLTPMIPRDNIDSPASWSAPDGRVWLIATAKETDQLVVYDGETGATLRRVGRFGPGLGEFERPNGIFVIEDLAFIVERDNRRVQVLRLPDFTPLLAFGATELLKPYGIWVRRTAGGAFDVLVTDNYERADGSVPPLDQLARRVKRYELTRDGDGWRARLSGTFGDTTPDGALRIVESIWGDEFHDRLLIAEEDESYANELKVYTLNGSFANRTVGRDRFAAQAEGIALWSCADGSGYWITTQQGKRVTVFHLFDRATFAHVGAFRGVKVANTDGIWWQGPSTSARFPDGVLYAVHDDQGVVAIDWRDIVRATGLRQRCDG
jgi:3-phytase